MVHGAGSIEGRGENDKWAVWSVMRRRAVVAGIFGQGGLGGGEALCEMADLGAQQVDLIGLDAHDAVEILEQRLLVGEGDLDFGQAVGICHGILARAELPRAPV